MMWQVPNVKRIPRLTGGIQATGNYPGKAMNGDQLRADIEEAMKYIPGTLKLNLHANYQEADHFVDRNEITPEHFEKWADWAVEKGIGLDFNPTYFSHPKSTEKGTLSCADEDIREVLGRARHPLPPDRPVFL